jgi:DNA-binding response OmpR family regulator
MRNDIRIADDGMEGIKPAQAYRPDLIVVDISLAKLNGCDACRRTRQQAWAKDALIVAPTGWAR